MDLAEPVTSAWHARLSLGFERREASTILARRQHVGPLRVQKALYPEGEAVCHAILLHPPSGIAGGDQLAIEVDVADAAQALLTTPGAGKWYRSAGPLAAQDLHFRLAEAGTLEWLPQETIVFDGARAAMTSRIELTGSARYFGWEVLCLGRRAAGERFTKGVLDLHTRIERDGRPIWLERGRIGGGSPLLDSAAGLAGFSVSGTLLASGATPDAELWPPAAASHPRNPAHAAASASCPTCWWHATWAIRRKPHGTGSPDSGACCGRSMRAGSRTAAHLEHLRNPRWN
jgi:urease accessory protein